MVTFPAPSSPLAQDIGAAWQWWREAGVDQDFGEEPVDWLLRPQVEEASAAPDPLPVAAEPPRSEPIWTPDAMPPFGGDPAGWPRDLGDFAAWWLAEPSLDQGEVRGRVAPRGPAEAELMVLVDHPDAQDSTMLLSGPRGRLLDAIVRAIGIDPGQVYLASVLSRHMPLPDWDALAQAGVGALALHHVALARPRRLISFDPNVSSLLGHNPTKTAEPLRPFYHVGASVPALAAPGLDELMTRPGSKGRLWQALLEWLPA